MSIEHTRIPLGTKVIVKQNIEGNVCEPFVGLKGKTIPPLNRGCQNKGWTGVRLETNTIYGTDFNFHVDELEIIAEK